MGISAINPFELPLLNTIILLSSGVTVTYSHHSLIQGNRRGTLYGLIFTVFLALIFTFFQVVEYSVSSFTISDGAYGSCFYFGTGFHGLISVAPIIYNYFILKRTYNKNYSTNTVINDELLVTIPFNKEPNSYILRKDFLE
jgi:heme/copper-type cytochrome/quinol oxidase subunit 3